MIPAFPIKSVARQEEEAAARAKLDALTAPEDPGEANICIGCE